MSSGKCLFSPSPFRLFWTFFFYETAWKYFNRIGRGGGSCGPNGPPRPDFPAGEQAKLAQGPPPRPIRLKYPGPASGSRNKNLHRAEANYPLYTNASIILYQRKSTKRIRAYFYTIAPAHGKAGHIPRPGMPAAPHACLTAPKHPPS